MDKGRRLLISHAWVRSPHGPPNKEVVTINNSVKRNREKRQEPAHRGRFFVYDARRFDKRKGFVCSLSIENASKLLDNECQFCGENGLQMTLDRIDNNIGHSDENVIPACIRCNLLRRDMPFVAWNFLAPKIREARELGLFGNWTGQIHKKDKI